MVSPPDLRQFTHSLQEYVQSHLPGFATQRFQSVKTALGTLCGDDGTILEQAHIPVVSLLERVNRVELVNSTPQLDFDALRGRCEVVRRRPAAATVFKQCRAKVPFFGRRVRSSIMLSAASLFAIFPFLYRWPRTQWDPPILYRFDSDVLGQFLLDTAITPWMMESRGTLEAKLTAALEYTRKALGVVQSEIDTTLREREGHLMLLLATKGNLHGASTALMYLQSIH